MTRDDRHDSQVMGQSPKAPRTSIWWFRAAGVALALIAIIAGAAVATTTLGASPVAQLGYVAPPRGNTAYWAYAVRPMSVRSSPNGRARVRGSVHRYTEDGFAEVYPVLAQVVNGNQTWFEVRIPGRPNGRTGWVQRGALGSLYTTHQRLVLDKRRRRLTLYSSGRKIFSAPAGIGSPSAPTPSGEFWIRERFPVKADPAYGPYAFGTAAYAVLSDWPHGGVVGIHGTNQPWLVPGNPSHGCIRLHNGDVSRLWQLLGVGTPLTIV